MKHAETRTPWPIATAIAVAVFVAFIPALHGQFLSWDDAPNFVANYHYRGLGTEQLKWMWTTTLMGHYTPLAWMSLGFDYVLWGMDPEGYHLTNLLLHCLNAVLLFVLARRLFSAAGMRPGSRLKSPRSVDACAALTALFYGLHPLRVESVAWITERRDVLSMALCLITVLLYLNAVTRGRKNTRTYGLALFTFACALLAKATSVTFPMVLLMLNVFPFRRVRGRGDLRGIGLELAPFFALSIAIGMIAVVAVSASGQAIPAADRVAVSVYSIGFYVWKSIVPLGLSPFYEMPTVIAPFSPHFLAFYAVTGAFIAAIVMAWRKRRIGLVVCAACFVIVSAPLLGVVQNGMALGADRYTYHAGPALAFIFGAFFGISGMRSTRALAGFAVVTLFAVLTWNQTKVWESSMSLWTRAILVDSTSAFARNNMGVLLAEEGKSKDAIAEYRESVAIRPDYADARNNLGYELAVVGDTAQAIDELRRAVDLKPGYADAEVNLGNLLLQANKLDSAISHYQRAAAADSTHAGAELDWGVALAVQGRLADAIPHFERAAVLDPGSDDARQYLARARGDLAVQESRQALPR